ncbi:unnamed protein product [Ectocarpus sp. 12 AP-2014]
MRAEIQGLRATVQSSSLSGSRVAMELPTFMASELEKGGSKVVCTILAACSSRFLSFVLFLKVLDFFLFCRCVQGEASDSSFPRHPMQKNGGMSVNPRFRGETNQGQRSGIAFRRKPV